MYISDIFYLKLFLRKGLFFYDMKRTFVMGSNGGESNRQIKLLTEVLQLFQSVKRRFRKKDQSKM